MALQKDTSNLKDTPPKLKSTLATDCVYCHQKFKERDNLTIIDGNALHQNCSSEYVNQLEIQQFAKEFPYISVSDIDQILYTEGKSAFQTIRDDPWIVLVHLGNQECTISGHPDKTAVEQFIVTHYEEEASEQQASIGDIFHNRTKYNYSVSITASVSQA